jgi:predicted DCC family thiol-disulfide oxidoreductase YuxK
MEQKSKSFDQYDHIILFDGICNLCSAFLHFVYQNDKRSVFKFAWIQSEQGTEILEQLQMPTHHYNTIVYIAGGRHYIKSTAFLEIVRYLRFPWPLLRIGYVVPLVIRERIYDLVASYRYKIFGKKESCQMPTGDLRSRFLLL